MLLKQAIASLTRCSSLLTKPLSRRRTLWQWSVCLPSQWTQLGCSSFAPHRSPLTFCGSLFSRCGPYRGSGQLSKRVFARQCCKGSSKCSWRRPGTQCLQASQRTNPCSMRMGTCGRIVFQRVQRQSRLGKTGSRS